METNSITINNPITPDVAYFFRIFDNQIRLVGGCVRDYVMQKKMHDYDFATPLLPEIVIKILENNNVPVYTTGLKHGTVTAVYHHVPYEITTLRSDIKTDGRHTDVHFVADYETDAQRRDFTMNALYMDSNGTITDYTGGLQDIRDNCIRFIGNAEYRVQEDYLRILRYFRFISYFGVDNVDKPSLTACKKHRFGLTKISIERIRSEMLRLLCMPFVIESLKLMKKARVSDILLPACHINRLEKFLKIYPHANALERLVILINEAHSIDWNWSKEQKKLLNLYTKDITFNYNNNNHNRYILWKIGRSAFLFHIARTAADSFITEQQKNELQNLKLPVFPVSAADIISLGFKGAEIGKQLKKSEELWAQRGLPDEKKLVIQYLLDYNKNSTE